MFNLIKYLIHYFDLFSSIEMLSFLCLGSSLLAYSYKYYRLSFFLLYVSLTYGYFFVILTKEISSITITYDYYFSIFLFYHFYFTFSKRFYCRTIVVIKKYLNGFEYFKLILWIVLVFIPALFGEAFIFLMVFNPLFGFSIVTANFSVFFFLLILWLWMFILILCNKLKIFNDFLLKILTYFSREACLHFIGNNPGKLLCEKVGLLVVCSPIVVSIPATGGYVLEKEAQTGNYAINKMHEYQANHPNSTHDQQYKVYQNSYKSHANSSLIGRGLSRWGVMNPGVPEVVIPDYKSDLKNSLSSLDKK